MKKPKRINEGYEIIYSSDVGQETEVVLGRHTKTGMFVTWICHKKNNYFWGHYFESESCALIDLGERIEGEKNNG